MANHSIMMNKSSYTLTIKVFLNQYYLLFNFVLCKPPFLLQPRAHQRKRGRGMVTQRVKEISATTAGADRLKRESLKRQDASQMATSHCNSLFDMLSPHWEEGEKVGGLSDRVTAGWARRGAGARDGKREKIERRGEEDIRGERILKQLTWVERVNEKT